MGGWHRRRWGRLLHRYVDDELEEAQRFVFAGHLARCPSCRRDLAEVLRLKASLHRLGQSASA